MIGFAAGEKQANKSDNSPIETDGVYVDKCECGNWKVSQDGECSLCGRGRGEMSNDVLRKELEKCRGELLRTTQRSAKWFNAMEKKDAVIADYENRIAELQHVIKQDRASMEYLENHTLQAQLLSDEKGKVEVLKADVRELLAERQDDKKLVNRCEDERSVLIARIRRMERQRSIALLALEEEI